jgi:hypothetical protein
MILRVSPGRVMRPERTHWHNIEQRTGDVMLHRNEGENNLLHKGHESRTDTRAGAFYTAIVH